MSSKKQRSRELHFNTLDEILRDVEKLHQEGYTQSGNWSLGQIASHLAQWGSFPLDGFPTPPLPLKILFWVLQRTGVTRRMTTKILRDGFSPGTPTDPKTVPPNSISDAEGLEQLRKTIERIINHDGPLHPSPLFGQMAKPRMIQVNLLHAAHHLSYLAPK